MDCQQCGACCRWLPIARKDKAGHTQLAYLRERADKETETLFLINSPCKHLKEHLVGSVINGERVTKEHTTCAIYEKRPLICRMYKGKKHTNGVTYYVPEGCYMAVKDA